MHALSLLHFCHFLHIFFYALESDILRPILYPFLYTMGWKKSEIVCTLFSVFAGNIPISNPFIWCFMIKSTIPVGTNMLRRCSQTMLTRLWLFFDHSYLRLADIGERIPLLLKRKICKSLTFPLPPSYLPHLVNVVKGYWKIPGLFKSRVYSNVISR